MTSASESRATLVEDMLLDAGCQQDTDLRDALLSLGTLSALPTPAPTGALAALIAAGGPAAVERHVPSVPAEEPADGPAGGEPDVQRDDELARRRRRHRPTALGLVLVAGMGLGVGGVAASSTPSGISATEHVLEEWVPWSTPAAGPLAAGPLAAGPGYRAPTAAPDAELSVAGPPAPDGAANPAHLGSPLLQDPAGAVQPENEHAGMPACAAPEDHGDGNGAEECPPAAFGAGSQGNGAGRSKEKPEAEGAQAGPRDAESKGGPAASRTAPAGEAADGGGKAPGPAAKAPAPDQAGSPAPGQGGRPKQASASK